MLGLPLPPPKFVGKIKFQSGMLNEIFMKQEFRAEAVKVNY